MIIITFFHPSVNTEFTRRSKIYGHKPASIEGGTAGNTAEKWYHFLYIRIYICYNFFVIILKAEKSKNIIRGGTRMKILIADDEADIRNLIKIALEENGYTVLAARNGREALDILMSDNINLAVLDVMMPVMDGFNLLRKIREHSTVPVIMLTARTDDMDKVLGLGLGADDYISKPFSVSELIARVGAHLRRSNEYLQWVEKTARITYGNLSVDKEKCCVSKNGETIELGAKEYKLLLYFMENPERIFTKRQLYNAVWEEEYYYDDNTIMVHISRIRSRIEDDPQKPKYLKTVRGIGYKLHYTGENP